MAQLGPELSNSILDSRISEDFRAHARFVIARFNDPESEQLVDPYAEQRRLVHLAFVDCNYPQTKIL